MVRFEPGGTLSGAACWRADGHAVGIGGGFARPGASFRPTAYRNEPFIQGGASQGDLEPEDQTQSTQRPASPPDGSDGELS